MTATIRPIKCPHGADLLNMEGVVTVYYDGCRVTSGIPPRFWCGEGEMIKPNGVSITAGEYLRDWSEAIRMNVATEFLRWLLERKAEEDARNLEAAHAEALILNEGDELYDEAARMNEDYEPTCTFRGLISKRPCTLPLDHDGAHSVWSDTDPWTVQAMNDQEHADFLGEVPWSDRVDD